MKGKLALSLSTAVLAAVIIMLSAQETGLVVAQQPGICSSPPPQEGGYPSGEASGRYTHPDCIDERRAIEIYGNPIKDEAKNRCEVTVAWSFAQFARWCAQVCDEQSVHSERCEVDTVVFNGKCAAATCTATVGQSEHTRWGEVFCRTSGTITCRSEATVKRVCTCRGIPHPDYL